MEPFTTVTGTTAPLDRANVDTDQIMPKEFLKRIERTGFGAFLFHNWRQEETDFVLERPEFRDAPILVAGPNFGSGSSREHAPWGLQDWGYKVVIAPSFADIFRSNCGKIGLLTVQLDEADVRELLDAAPAEITVSLEDRTVTMPGGRVVAFEIDDKVRENLINGWDDIALTLLREDKISEYERDRERQGPSTLSLG
jgi:3-isopropylmalate/(R)-2-methylmalate dehydratase small subunit